MGASMYFRITCENIGVYEYLKQYIFKEMTNPKEEWNNFLRLECNSWLEKPEVYKNEDKAYYSYFTEKGYNQFINTTFKEIKKIIQNKDYKIEIVNIDDRNIVFKDDYQIVIEIEKLNKSREFCSKVKELAKDYNLSFFVVTDGASAISNNGCEAVKHARDCHIEWEKQNNYDPYEDWLKDKGKNNE